MTGAPALDGMLAAAAYEVGVVTRDVDRLVAWYTSVLGMRIWSDIVVPAEVSARTGLSPEGYRVVRLETNLGQRFKIAAAPGTRPAAPCPEFPMQTAASFYVTFLVTGIAGLYERLRGHGVAIDSDGVVEVRPGVWLFLARDPADTYLEFVEYADLAAYHPGAAAR